MMRCTKPVRISVGILLLMVFASLVLFPSVAAEQKLRIGYHAAFAGQGEIYETLVHTNILELNGINADFKVFAYGGPLAEGAVAGELDLGMAADVPILRVVGRRPDWKVVNRTHDWIWFIMTRPESNIRGLEELHGKRLAVPFGTSVFPRALRRLMKAGFKEPLKEMSIINNDLNEQVAAVQSKSVDAVVTWPPTSEKLLRAGLVNAIYRSSEGDGLAWQALGPKVLKDKDLTVRYLKAFIMAVWWASNNLDVAQKWYAETSKITPDMLRLFANDDRHLRAPVEDIKTIDLSITPEEISDVQGVMDFLVEQRLLTAKMDVNSAIDNSYILQAQKEIQEGIHPRPSQIRIVKP
jgi:ABC-type nitrate/sulfonate/bicarbonate transport system substrate-binding protein